MIGRYVRYMSLAFSLFSVFYWLSAATFFQLIDFVQDEGKVSSGAKWGSSAVPTVIYGVLCALFLQWFARGIVRRMQTGEKH